MKPDWREIGWLEMEIYGYVRSEEAALALITPLPGCIAYENAEATQRRYIAITTPPKDAA